MFPQIVSPAATSNKINSNQLRDRPNDLLALQRFDRLVPIIGNTIRETKSSGAKEALMKLMVHSKILFFEIAVIRIQTIYRCHLAKKRVALIKHHVALFNEITSTFNDRIVEEVVLAMGFEISLNIIKNHRRYEILKRMVEDEMQFLMEDLVDTEVREKCSEVVLETITEATDYIARRRYVHYSS